MEYNRIKKLESGEGVKLPAVPAADLIAGTLVEQVAALAARVKALEDAA